MANKNSIVKGLKRSTVILAMTTLTVSSVLPTTPINVFGTTTASASEGDVVSITDAKLQKFLNLQLGQKSDAEITDAQLATLSGTLNLSSVGVTDLSGLEKATNISGLILDDNVELESLSPLKYLTNLVNISIKNTNFDLNSEDVLEELKDIPNLSYLDASGTPTETLDLKTLTESNPSLKTLLLKNNEVSYLNANDTAIQTLVIKDGTGDKLGTSTIPTVIFHSEDASENNLILKVATYNSETDTYVYLDASNLTYSVKDVVKDDVAEKEVENLDGNYVKISLDEGDNFENRFHSLKVILSEDVNYSITMNTTAQDITPPEKPTLEISDRDYETKETKLKANFSDDSVTKQYRVDGGDWTDYTEEISAIDDSKFEFRALDRVGNVSDVTTRVIDTPKATSDITEKTNKSVKVTINYNENAVTKLYKVVDSEGEVLEDWKEYTEPITIENNATVFAKSENADAEESVTLEYRIENIDKVAPDAPEVTPSTTERTSDDVLLTAKFSDDTDKKQYKKSTETEWKNYTSPIRVSDNGSYDFRALDDVGNISDVTSYEVENIIDITPIIQPSKETPTNQNITANVIFGPKSKKQYYKLEGDTDWKVYTGEILITDNTVIYAKSTNAKNLDSDVAVYSVTNIDRVPPEKATLTPNVPNEVFSNKVKVTATFTDTDIELKEYRFIDEENKDSGWKPLVDDAYTTGINGTLYVRSTDEAGNMSEESSYEVKNIDRIPPEVKIESLGNSTFKITTTDDRQVSPDKNYYVKGLVDIDFFRNNEKPQNGVDNPDLDIKYLNPNGNMRISGDESGQFTVYVSDGAGNDVIKQFAQDVSGPKLEIERNNYFKYATITSTDDDLDSIKYVFSKSEIEPDNENGYTSVYDHTIPDNKLYTPNGEEEYFLHIIASDKSGNKTYRTVEFFKEADSFDFDAFKESTPSISVDTVDFSLISRKVKLNGSNDMDKILYKIIPPNTSDEDIENIVWDEYKDEFLVNDNVTIMVKGYNKTYGVDSGITSYQITDIENQKPAKPSLLKAPTVKTKKPVRIFLDLNSENKNYYRFKGEKDWYTYSFGAIKPEIETKSNVLSLLGLEDYSEEPLADGNIGIKLKNNGILEVKAVSPTGVESDIAEINIDIFDMTPPIAPNLSPSETAPTNEDVFVTFNFPISDDIELDTWAYKTNKMKDFVEDVNYAVFEENGSVEVKYKTSLGVWSEVAKYDVTNIDKIAPDKPKLTPSVTEKTETPYNVDLSLTEENPKKVEYSVTEGDTYTDWKEYDSSKKITVDKNGYVKARVTDQAGNVSEIAKIAITNFTNSPQIKDPDPANPSVPSDPTNPTNPDDKDKDKENPDDKDKDKENPDDKDKDKENPDDKDKDKENPDDKDKDKENPDDKDKDKENPDGGGTSGGNNGDGSNTDNGTNTGGSGSGSGNGNGEDGGGSGSGSGSGSGGSGSGSGSGSDGTIGNNNGDKGDNLVLDDFPDYDLDDNNVGKSPTDVNGSKEPTTNLPPSDPVITMPDYDLDSYPDDDLDSYPDGDGDPDYDLDSYPDDDLDSYPDDDLDEDMYDISDEDDYTLDDLSDEEVLDGDLPQTGHEETNSTQTSGLLTLLLSVLTFGLYRRKLKKETEKQ